MLKAAIAARPPPGAAVISEPLLQPHLAGGGCWAATAPSYLSYDRAEVAQQQQLWSSCGQYLNPYALGGRQDHEALWSQSVQSVYCMGGGGVAGAGSVCPVCACCVQPMYSMGGIVSCRVHLRAGWGLHWYGWLGPCRLMNP